MKKFDVRTHLFALVIATIFWIVFSSNLEIHLFTVLCALYLCVAGYKKATLKFILTYLIMELLALATAASLSGGEKQRVTIAAAYCSDADIIVLDEPTSGMDGEGVLSLAKWVSTLAEKGKTIIIITHDEILCEIACDNKLVIGGKKN